MHSNHGDGTQPNKVFEKHGVSDHLILSMIKTGGLNIAFSFKQG